MRLWLVILSFAVVSCTTDESPHVKGKPLDSPPEEDPAQRSEESIALEKELAFREYLECSIALRERMEHGFERYLALSDKERGSHLDALRISIKQSIRLLDSMDISDSMELFHEHLQEQFRLFDALVTSDHLGHWESYTNSELDDSLHHAAILWYDSLYRDFARLEAQLEINAQLRMEQLGIDSLTRQELVPSQDKDPFKPAPQKEESDL